MENGNMVLHFDARRIRRISWVERNAILVVNRDRDGEETERVMADPSILQILITQLRAANPWIAVEAPVPDSPYDYRQRWR